MTTEQTRPDRNPDHNQHAAGLYNAMALRFYSRYVDAREKAAFRGSDLENHGPTPSNRKISEDYADAVQTWIFEPPSTIEAVVALVEFAGVIAADKLTDEVLSAGGLVGEEKDALHQIVALSAARDFLDDHARGEWLDRRLAAYGPGAMAPGERAEFAARWPEPTTAAANSDDPLPAMVDEYFRLIAEREPLDEGERSENLYQQAEALTQRIVDMVATTPAGMLAQLRLLRHVQEGASGWADKRDIRLLNAITAGIERLRR